MWWVFQNFYLKSIYIVCNGPILNPNYLMYTRVVMRGMLPSWRKKTIKYLAKWSKQQFLVHYYQMYIFIIDDKNHVKFIKKTQTETVIIWDLWQITIRMLWQFKITCSLTNLLALTVAQNDCSKAWQKRAFTLVFFSSFFDCISQGTIIIDENNFVN